MRHKNHTPHPWHVSITNTGADYDVGAADNSNVAMVYASDTDTGRANARLIAAAPELLDALRMCVIAIGDELYEGSSNKIIYDNAEALISKIELGEEVVSFRPGCLNAMEATFSLCDAISENNLTVNDLTDICCAAIHDGHDMAIIELTMMISAIERANEGDA